MMELDEEMTVAGWDGKNGRGSYEIKVKLGGQNLLMGTIQRVVGSERVWDDSGCEVSRQATGANDVSESLGSDFSSLSLFGKSGLEAAPGPGTTTPTKLPRESKPT